MHVLDTVCLLWIFLWNFVTAQGRNDMCPAPCFCNRNSNIVYCTRRGLQRIPIESIATDTEQLNINGNIFQSSLIQRANFSTLTSLKHIYLGECGIEEIAPDTFADLRRLEWLDLSNNRLKVIQDFTFSGLRLKHLFLNGNHNIRLRDDSFAGLVTSGLMLHQCSLSDLKLEAFKHLNNTLENLWLHQNEIKRIDEGFQSVFLTLSHIRLGANPFHCNCEIRWLRELYANNPEKFSEDAPPTCHTPAQWRSKTFSEVELQNFICQEPYFKNIDAVLNYDKGMLRCTVSGDPTPELYWIQPSGTTTFYPPSKNASLHFNEAVLNISAKSTRKNDLSGSYFCIAKNDAGSVTFTFNLTWPTSESSQTVVNKPDIHDHDHEDDDKILPAQIDLKGVPGYNPDNKETEKDDEEYEDDIVIPTGNTNKVNSKSLIDNILSKSTTTSTTNIPSVNTDDSAQSQNRHTESSGIQNASNESINKDIELVRAEKLFTLQELIGAILGTFFSTLLLCLILIPLYFHKRWKSSSSPRHEPVGTKKSVHEVRYLNGLGSHSTQTYNYTDYFDTHGSVKR